MYGYEEKKYPKNTGRIVNSNRFSDKLQTWTYTLLLSEMLEINAFQSWFP